MHFYLVAVVIALLIVLGLVLKRGRLAQQHEQTADAPATDGAAAQTGAAAQWIGTLRNRLQRWRNGEDNPEAVPVATQFRQWIATTLAAEPALQGWLAALTDEQLTALAAHLAEFGRDMGFELDWLLAEQLDAHPGLKRSLTQIVLLYSRASYQAVAIQEEVEVFRAYHDYLQNPNRRANRELGEQLFGELVEQGLSDITIAAHLASSAGERQQQIQETIQRVAGERPALFHPLFKRVLLQRTRPADVPHAVGVNGNAATTATVAVPVAATAAAD